MMDIFPVRPRARAGFSMIELVVVLMIVGVTGMISAGRIRDLIVKNRIARAATAVQNDLEAAFAISARNRRPIQIAWDSATMRLAVTDRAGTLSFRRTALGPDAYGLRANAVKFSRNPIEVYPNGLANDTLAITLNVLNMTKRVRMSRSGLVRVE